MKLSVIKRNVFANLVGTSLVTVLTVLITPLQINILGMEAYGVVGFIATLQVMFAAFDLGLSSTLTRELAADSSLDKKGSQNLLSTAATIYWCSALLVGVLIAAFAAPISRWWFHAEKLSPEMLVISLRVIALYLALRWPAALYVGILSGLQRMDVLNIVKVIVVAVRLAGGILVLLQWRTLDAFLYWTAISAIIEVATYWFTCRKIFPNLSFQLGFSGATIQRVWRYSLSMNVLSIFAVVLVQLDKVFISKMEALSLLGTYNLAYTAASCISIVISSLNSAIFPWITEVHHRNDRALTVQRYYNANRAMMFCVTLLAAILIGYGNLIIKVWINKSVAGPVMMPIILLVSGFWVSAAIANVYNVAIAYGKPGTHLRVGLLSFVPYAIALYLLIRGFGIIGAALAWLLLNIVYGLFLIPILHRNLLGVGIRHWMFRTIAPFVLFAAISFGIPRLALFLYGDNSPYLQGISLVVGAIIYCYLGYRVLSRNMQLNFLSMRRSGGFRPQN